MSWASERCKPQPRRVAIRRHAPLRRATPRRATHRNEGPLYGGLINLSTNESRL